MNGMEDLMQDAGLGQPYIPAQENVSLPWGTKVVLPGKGSAKFPGVWTIVKINAASYGLKQGSVPLRAHKSLCREATPAEIAAFDAAPETAHFLPGELVRAPHAHKMNTTALYVVLSDKSLNPTAKIKVALLGAEGLGRTWTVPRTFLVKVSLAEAGLL